MELVTSCRAPTVALFGSSIQPQAGTARTYIQRLLLGPKKGDERQCESALILGDHYTGASVEIRLVGHIAAVFQTANQAIPDLHFAGKRNLLDALCDTGRETVAVVKYLGARGKGEFFVQLESGG